MNQKTHTEMRCEEEKIRERLEDLKSRIMTLHEDIPCMTQCSRLSGLLQNLYEIREGLDQLEQGLLRTHLKCCISPGIKVPKEVALAVSRLSQKRHGAIIVIEQKTELDKHIRGGAVIDAMISAPILENIFYPGSPLHDGAVIIRKATIRKANVLLPLAPHTPEMDSLGLASRHRAALGLSQVSDALILVVSEEKGWISMALKGQLYPNLGTFAFLEKLENKT
ncbi:MAG: DNA integrity scanning protein DisA nucleotide-binding domain protein, partial [Deltaproteobacteria bacterium]|nr:DNA integrity scanning protein DisA nucleotide-binding domain protein [Deltaproteobacteria bacterium]